VFFFKFNITNTLAQDDYKY